MFYWVLRYTVGLMIKLLWIREVTGLENVPKNGAVILAANHSSYLDFWSMGSVLNRRIYFLAAEKFYTSAFWKPIMVFTGQIKVDRKGKDKSVVINSANSILSTGKVLGIFPEGTRSRTGRLQKAYLGVAKFARENKCPIVPVAITGAYEVMSPQDKFPRFKKVIKLHFLLPITPNIISSKSDDDIVHSILMPTIAKEIGQKYE